MRRQRQFRNESAEMTYLARILKFEIMAFADSLEERMFIGVGLPSESARYKSLKKELVKTFRKNGRAISIRSELLRVPWGHLAISIGRRRWLYDVKQTLLELRVTKSATEIQRVIVPVSQLEWVDLEFCNWRWVPCETKAAEARCGRNLARCFCSSTSQSS